MKPGKLYLGLWLCLAGISLSPVTAAKADTKVRYTAKADERRDGYYVDNKKPIACTHLQEDSAYIYVRLKGLKNTQSSLKENVKLIKNGNRAFKYTISMSTKKVEGIGSEKVSSNVLSARIEGHNFELAYPYVCKDDGHSGYAYIKCYFSYCENTEKWYFLGSSHYWLGCSRGDIGDNEAHTINYSHKIYEWKKNNGIIQYHANNGQPQENYMLSSGMVRNKAGNALVSNSFHYETEEIDLYNVEALLTRVGYHVIGKNAWLIGNRAGNAFTQNKTSDLLPIKQLILTGNATTIFYANWQPNKYKIAYNSNGGTGEQKESECIYDKEFRLPGNTFSNQGYVFKGWNTRSDGKGQQFPDEAVIKNLSSANADTVVLYAQWEKRYLQVAYSGNEQSGGDNMLDPDIWTEEQNYRLRDSAFEKIRQEKLIFDDMDKEYEYEMRYGFKGWTFEQNTEGKDRNYYKSNKDYPVAELYLSAQKANAITKGKPIEEKPYVLLKESSRDHAKDEFINLYAVWDAYPVIIPTESNELFMEHEVPIYYEGEVVKKEDLMKHLIVNDKEDGDIKDQLKILKISYQDSKNRAGYAVQWQDDMPEDYVLDTYFMELDKDEMVEHLVTYSVTDSSNHTTKKELPVKVKYNNFPEIEAEEVLYYFKEDVNHNKVTESELVKQVKVFDLEDGESIREKLELLDFDEQEVKLQLKSEMEYRIRLKVTDAYHKTTYKHLKIAIVDAEAVISELPKTYIRFISNKHTDTLEKNSIWREKENLSYLVSALRNNQAIDTWYFTKENMIKAKDWLTENGEGEWKAGQEANQEFMKIFASCKIN